MVGGNRIRTKPEVSQVSNAGDPEAGAQRAAGWVAEVGRLTEAHGTAGAAPWKAPQICPMQATFLKAQTVLGGGHGNPRSLWLKDRQVGPFGFF
jgi:hypothetical protein